MLSADFKYCITCGQFVQMYWNNFHLKTLKSFSLQGDDITLAIDCEGPFTECPPPDELEEDWQDNMPLPSCDEYSMPLFDYDVYEDQIVMVELI